MERISSISNSLTSSKKDRVVRDSLVYFRVNELLGVKGQKITEKLRNVLQSSINPLLDDYLEKAEFPEKVIEVFKAHNLGHYFVDEELGYGSDSFERAAIVLELARINASVSTLLMVQTKLCMRTIELYGSEKQKSHYLPLLRDFDIIGGWGLTEDDNGSDASNMQSTVRYENGNYILNGNKRWIGNANKVKIQIRLLLGYYHCLCQECGEQPG